MADTYTTNLNLTKPEPGAAEDTWGISLNADLDSLDAIFSTSGTQINLNPNQINFADGKKLILGTGSDLQIYHDGSHSRLVDSGTGNFIIQAAQFRVNTSDDAEAMIKADVDGAVNLYHNGSAKLATTSTGINVTGTVTSDGLTVDGTAQINGTNAGQLTLDATGQYNQITFEQNSGNNSGGDIVYDHTNDQLWLRSLAVGSVHLKTGTTAGNTVDRLKVASNGDISFYDDTGSTQGFFWDSSAERLGVGTTAPAAKLDVRAANGSEISLNIGRSDTGSYFKVNHAGDDLRIYNTGGSGKDILFGVDAAGTNQNNKVGIGTASPSSALDVTGTVTSDALTVSNGTNTTSIPTTSDRVAFTGASLNYVQSAGNLFIQPTGDLTLNGSSSEIMRLKDGKVGIGTSSPSNILHIQSASATGAILNLETTHSSGIPIYSMKGAHSAQLRYQDENGNNQSRIDFLDGGDFNFIDATSGTSHMKISSSGNVGIGTISPDALLEIDKGSEGEYLRVGGDNASNARSLRFTSSTASGSSVGALHTIKANSVGGEIAFANGNGNIMYLDVNRNVGIGTSSPARNLHVHASNFTDLHLTNDTTGATASDGTSFTAIGSDIYLTNREAGNMVFQTSGTERARIDSSGNLAIGNISAAAKLDIRQDSGSAIRCEDGSGAYFVVKQGGLVGIGTPSPDAPLTVHNSSDPEIRFGYSSTQDHKIAWDSSKVFIHADPENANGSSAIGFAVDGSEKARITSTGRLGLNTTNPTTDFEVNATGANGIKITSDQPYLFFNDTDNAGTAYDSSISFSNDSMYIGGASAASIVRFRNKASFGESARLDTSGNLLVGTTSTAPYASTSSTAQGIAIRGDFGLIGASRPNNYSLSLNRAGTDGDIVNFRKDGLTVGNIGCPDGANGSQLVIAAGTNGTNTGVGLRFTSFTVKNIIPCYDDGSSADNLIDLGTSSARFDDIYATNGTIQTSDRNEKQDIQALTDAEQRVATACKGLIRRFRWQDAVEEKGDDARLHFGVIAQDLQDAFTAEGLDAGNYGMFISSTWEDDDGVEQTRLGVRYNELLAFIITTL
jgi:cytoskeletal protein CcmA (bactofilin family)